MADEDKKCPNCAGPLKDHPENGCVLAALIRVIQDRDSVSDEDLLEIHENVDVDALWDDLGPIIDKLEAGEYAEQG